MSKVTKNEIKHIAKLADLNLSEKQVEKFQKQLSAIVEYISHLDEVNTLKIKPTSQTTGLTNIKREDELRNEVLTVEEALSGTNEIHNNFFKIPAIFETEEN